MNRVLHLFVLALAMPLTALAAPIDESGGLRPGTRVVHVTTLADSGPGSFRAAVAARGSRVIVFDVSGYIQVTTPLNITEPYLTIAGQTAPEPGVVVRGSGINVRTHHVVIEHIGVFPGPAEQSRAAPNTDGIAVIGRSANDRTVHDVALRNVSVGWAPDENVSFAGDAVSNAYIESSIIAQGLRESGHPKGVHSMGILIWRGADNISISGNIFAANNMRNPRIGSGADVLFFNNFVYGYGERATEFAHVAGTRGTRARFLNNIYMPTQESSCSNPLMMLKGRQIAEAPDTSIVESGTDIDMRFARRDCRRLQIIEPGIRSLLRGGDSSSPDAGVMPTAQVYQHAMSFSGMRPASRTPIDQRILAGIRTGELGMIDRPVYPELQQRQVEVRAPAGDGPLTEAGVTTTRAWLCSEHRRLGGAPTASCR